MSKPASTPSLAAALFLSLSACVSTQGAPVPVASPVPARQAEIQRRLAPLCPTPSNLSADQKVAVADALEHSPQSAGLDLLASEWERLDAGARACRGAR